jgi:hypothetical protein
VQRRLLAGRPELRPVPLSGSLAAPLDRGVAGPGLWRLLTADGHDGFTVSVLERRR